MTAAIEEVISTLGRSAASSRGRQARSIWNGPTVLTA